MQVFFYFSGHGADGSGNDVHMYGNDEKPVSFYECFHKHVTSRASAVIAVLDCCRVESDRAVLCQNVPQPDTSGNDPDVRPHLLFVAFHPPLLALRDKQTASLFSVIRRII